MVAKIRLSKFFTLTVILITVMKSGLYAQQDPQYTMYYFNPLIVNPAVAGSRDALSMTLLGRNQWTGFDGAPQTGTFSVHTPLRREAIALGFTAFYDQIAAGSSKTTSLFADAAYRIQVTPTSRLSFGLKAGVRLFSGDYRELKVIDANDPLHDNPTGNSVLPNFGLGVYWHSSKFYVGLSAPKLLDNKFDKSVSTSNAKEDRHYFLTGGYTFKLSSVIEMLPSITVKAVQDAPISLDANLNFFFYEKLWLGAGYRAADAVTANVMFQFSPLFRAGYSYDYSVSPLSRYNSGSHEIMVNYDLDFLGKGFKTPRRF